MGNEDDPKKWTEMGVFEKIKYLMKNITIEPVLAMYIVLYNAELLVSTPFKVEKACVVNNHYPEDVCADIIAGVNTNATLLDNSQITVSQMNSWIDSIQNILNFILLLFIGSWSDRNRRRKPCFLLPLSGEVACMVGLLICTYFFNSLSVEVNGLIQGILPSITGGINCIQIAVFSYISDITKEDERTFRISLLSTLMTLVQPIGIYSSSIIYEYGKYYATFGICGVLYFVAFLYGLFFLKEPLKPKPLADNFCKDFFDYTHITDTMRTIFKKRENNGRLKILMVVLLSVLLTGPIVGEGKVGQLFMMKQLGWDLKSFSEYSTFYSIITIVGSLLVLALLGSNLKLNDCMLGIVACIMKIVVNILYSISKEGSTFYALAILEILSTASVTVMRSITTKLVPPEELGKLYAFTGIAAAGSAIFISSGYDLIYAFTLDTFPGAFFLVGVVMNGVGVLNFLFIYILQNRETKPDSDVNTSAVDNKGFEDIDLNNEINTKL